MNHLANIPEAENLRILSVKQMADLLGISIPHLRRLYRMKKVPTPLKIGERKLGWQFGTAAAFIATKSNAA